MTATYAPFSSTAHIAQQINNLRSFEDPRPEVPVVLRVRVISSGGAVISFASPNRSMDVGTIPSLGTIFKKIDEATNTLYKRRVSKDLENMKEHWAKVLYSLTTCPVRQILGVIVSLPDRAIVEVHARGIQIYSDMPPQSYIQWAKEIEVQLAERDRTEKPISRTCSGLGWTPKAAVDAVAHIRDQYAKLDQPNLFFEVLVDMGGDMTTVRISTDDAPPGRRLKYNRYSRCADDKLLGVVRVEVSRLIDMFVIVFSTHEAVIQEDGREDHTGWEDEYLQEKAKLETKESPKRKLEDVIFPTGEDTKEAKTPEQPETKRNKKTFYYLNAARTQGIRNVNGLIRNTLTEQDVRQIIEDGKAVASFVRAQKQWNTVPYMVYKMGEMLEATLAFGKDEGRRGYHHYSTELKDYYVGLLIQHIDQIITTLPQPERNDLDKLLRGSRVHS